MSAAKNYVKNIITDYYAIILPKKIAKQPLSQLDRAIDNLVEAAKKSDYNGMALASELIGRLMANGKVL